MLTEIKEAVAKGYCHPNNTMKVLDVDLCESITHEVEKVVRNELSAWQRFSSYCRSCALSGESNPQEFEEFCSRYYK